MASPVKMGWEAVYRLAEELLGFLQLFQIIAQL